MCFGNRTVVTHVCRLVKLGHPSEMTARDALRDISAEIIKLDNLLTRDIFDKILHDEYHRQYLIVSLCSFFPFYSKSRKSRARKGNQRGGWPYLFERITNEPLI